MATQPKSAAAALYPHLRSGARDEIVGRRTSLAEAMYGPRPSKDELWWQAWRERQRQSLLRHLREANGRGR
jgi:hypothetical protein